ncbi:IucA/IucC family siderophore biosynthesis protein [Paenibacillus albicereus]|uniref:IucA/IucC family siderophore biosynthesis protein n=1 Tax=Paenibacillus albicereus TaxID=2726185 RepID=A0A6H2GZF2_9BACL|nr:IucA/IucC family protein [Paenibacillus albicereus]QJC52813.1 IucA/IucC family siderophore biosynthesis protein [Paenibacillus albicereus]
MNEARSAAERTALQAMVNCYARETRTAAELRLPHEAPAGVQPGRAGSLELRLSAQGLVLWIGLNYYSPTGRHGASGKAWYRPELGGALAEADYVTASALLAQELALTRPGSARRDELLLRIIESCRNVEEIVAAALARPEPEPGEEDFLAAEQSLYFGHGFHPTPKSRQGMNGTEASVYCPELGGRFRLHYFQAHPSIVRERSAVVRPASELLRSELLADPEAAPELQERAADAGWTMLPVHPLQARWLLEQPRTQDWLKRGLLRDLGPGGREYLPTSSVRTVYHPDAAYMFKFSLRVKLTNSLRVMKTNELESGIEIRRLLDTRIGEACRADSGFAVMADPAYATLEEQGGPASGFEVVLRDNPFRGGEACRTVTIAALAQEPLPGRRSPLGRLIGRLAERTGLAEAEASRRWFRRYLVLSLRPLVRLHLAYGIALEAHMQNSLVELDGDGWPVRYWFRDNQGYYFSRSMLGVLERELPGIGSKSGDVYADEVTDEHLIYYLMVNHLFGLAGAFGSEGLAEEEELLLDIRRELEAFRPLDRDGSRFLERLLQAEELPCKGNLLTRLHDMDELELPLERQSVYVPIPNPLLAAAGLGRKSGGRRALAEAMGGGAS